MEDESSQRHSAGGHEFIREFVDFIIEDASARAQNALPQEAFGRAVDLSNLELASRILRKARGRLITEAEAGTATRHFYASYSSIPNPDQKAPAQDMDRESGRYQKALELRAIVQEMQSDPVACLEFSIGGRLDSAVSYLELELQRHPQYRHAGLRAGAHTHS